eukprot:11178254-Lingulodinium_polyedra.AAC.1
MNPYGREGPKSHRSQRTRNGPPAASASPVHDAAVLATDLSWVRFAKPPMHATVPIEGARPPRQYEFVFLRDPTRAPSAPP